MWLDGIRAWGLYEKLENCEASVWKKAEQETFQKNFFLRNEFLLKGRGHLAKSSNCAGNILASHTSD